MFLEEDADPKGFEFPDSFQTFGGISRESGYGLHQHLIDSSIPTVCKQSLEILPFFRGGSGDAFICIDVHQLPLVMGSNHFHIVAVLRSKAVDLVIGVRADTAVSRNPQDDFFLRHIGWYENLLSCQIVPCHCHSSPPLSATHITTPFLE